jgi:hypothetical protein
MTGRDHKRGEPLKKSARDADGLASEVENGNLSLSPTDSGRGQSRSEF